MKRFIVLLFLAPCAAHADWKYTHWGMTAPQIVAASKGAATAPPSADVPCAFNDKRPIATGRFQDYDVAFCSKDGRTLESVALRANSNPESVRRDLLSTYGQPVSQNRILTVWNDAKSRNTVTFIDIAGVGAVIEYKPMGTHATGL